MPTDARTWGQVGVALRWTVRDLERPDARFAGMSPADEAALEVALSLAERFATSAVAVTVGDDDARDVLHRALAAGAQHAVHVRVDHHPSSAHTAALLAAALGECTVVITGDASTDRGTGATPAFLAHELGAAQMLGVIAVRVVEGEQIEAVRRLDGGRREVLRTTGRVVISVERAAATLRRASLPSLIGARDSSAIRTVHAALPASPPEGPLVAYRPRAKVVGAPRGEDPRHRLDQLLGSGAHETGRGELVELAAPLAAARIVEQLRAWGYLGPPAATEAGR